jgi:DNA-binding NtrC family response regulator
MASILLVEDMENPRKAISMLLKKKGYQVEEAANGQKALELLNKQFFDLVITDYRMEPIDGLKVLEETKRSHFTTEVIVITAFGTIQDGVKAMKMHAFDYITKPFDNNEFLSLVESAIENRISREIKKCFHQKIIGNNRPQNIIAESRIMKRILKLVSRVAATESTVIIYGESGTGKEVIAKAIHANSNRHDKPLITINCGSLPESLLESELFGHIKGAFTGAFKDKKGLFEEVDQGTIFLDEIGEISPQTQVKLLRVLQDGDVRRVGDNRPIKVDVRVIAATNKNLEQEIEKKNFREDLYYRLNVIPIQLPPLRERKEEIPVFVDHFLKKICTKLNRPIPTITPEAMLRLMNYYWPGNVRELENMIERTIVLNDKLIFGADDFSFNSMLNHKGILSQRKNDQNFFLADAERQLILECLESCSGNQKLAAELLGISTTTLWRKLKNYDIAVEDLAHRA